MVNGFAGYSLLDDQLSGTGLRIAYVVVLSIPVIGTWIASLFFGGEFPGAGPARAALRAPRPASLPALDRPADRVHLAILVRHKHTHFPGPGRREDNVVGERLWPTYAAKALGAALPHRCRRLSLLGGLAQINPIWIYGPVPTRPTSAPPRSRTGTWAGSTARCGSCRLGDPRVRLRDPQPVLPRRAPAATVTSRSSTRGRSSRRGSRRIARAPRARPAPGPPGAHRARRGRPDFYLVLFGAPPT